MFRFTVLKVPISSIGRSSNLIDLLEYSLESFKVFHCSVIKVLCFVVISDNFYSISDVWSLVNNFLIYFFAFIAIRIDFCRASRVSLVIISCSPTIVNNKFHFFAFSFFNKAIDLFWLLRYAECVFFFICI